MRQDVRSVQQSNDLRAVLASGIVQNTRSTEIVTAFWDDVWNAHIPDAVDRYVADDVVIEAGGQEISGKDNIKNWVKDFLDHVNDLHLDAIETFQNEDGTRVTSRWVLTGSNNDPWWRRAQSVLSPSPVPSAVTEPVATCTSDVIDGVEVA